MSRIPKQFGFYIRIVFYFVKIFILIGLFEIDLPFLINGRTKSEFKSKNL
ncbi:hypothetical protein SRABI96_03850 [Peribacillus sp. Bi96]|nr:hypothetical protein SRABI96_03850 [Peribacillus sp. Bi96]